jgi:hypothetical protein
MIGPPRLPREIRSILPHSIARNAFGLGCGMKRLTTSELTRRLAPRLREHFHGRGVIDLRVFPNKPETLFVYVHLFCELGDLVDLEVLHALAAELEVEVERGCCYGHTVWIEVPAASPECVILPFPKANRRVAQLRTGQL